MSGVDIAGSPRDVADIPKVELHCHLDGILDPQILAEMHAAGVALDVPIAELSARTPVRTYEQFMRWAEAHDRRIEGDIDNFRVIIARHIARLRAQRVLYAELMVGTSEIPGDRVEMIDKLQAFRAFVDECEGGETQVELLVTINRKKAPAAVDEIAERAIILHGAGLIAGVALAGVEDGNPVRPFARTFERLRDAGVGVEIHAGEWCGAESVADALDHGHPRRIGHGVVAFGDARLLERMAAENVHVELCPTSNVCTGAVGSIGDHPMGRARASGLSFSINSDDPGPFACDVAGEYALASREFGFSEDDLVEVSRSALRARFQTRLRGWAARFALANGVA